MAPFQIEIIEKLERVNQFKDNAEFAEERIESRRGKSRAETGWRQGKGEKGQEKCHKEEVNHMQGGREHCSRKIIIYRNKDLGKSPPLYKIVDKTTKNLLINPQLLHTTTVCLQDGPLVLVWLG